VNSQGLAGRLVSEAVQCLNRRLDPLNATKGQLSTLELRYLCVCVWEKEGEREQAQRES